MSNTIRRKVQRWLGTLDAEPGTSSASGAIPAFVEGQPMASADPDPRARIEGTRHSELKSGLSRHAAGEAAACTAEVRQRNLEGVGDASIKGLGLSRSVPTLEPQGLAESPAGLARPFAAVVGKGVIRLMVGASPNGYLTVSGPESVTGLGGFGGSTPATADAPLSGAGATSWWPRKWRAAEWSGRPAVGTGAVVPAEGLGGTAVPALRSRIQSRSPSMGAIAHFTFRRQRHRRQC